MPQRPPLARARRSAPGRLFGGAWLIGVALVSVVGPGCPKPPPPTVTPPPPSRESLAPGDEIDVRVFDEKRFDGLYEVHDDGTIDFPLVGSIAVAGKSAAEVGRLLEERLADGYLQRPQVAVAIKARENREVSVLGQVKEPGSFPFQDRLTLVQAVSLAGGLTPFAAPRRVKLTRRIGSGDATETVEISLQSIIDGKAEDVALRPGDIVFIPESFL